MAKYTILIGCNYANNPKSKDYELGASSAHQCGSVIAKVIEDEPKAINFQILVQRKKMLYPKTDTNAKANHRQLIMVPRAGKKFVFKRTPGASYASVGVVYTCSGYPSDGYGDIYITRADKSSGTYDKLSAWEWAEWEYVDEKGNP